MGLAGSSAKETFDLSAALLRPAPDTDDPSTGRYDDSKPGSNDYRPITSSLPADDPVFREIVSGFVQSLGAKVQELEVAWQRRDLSEISRLAHWIKGCGGTVGFDHFTHPSMKLQEAADQGRLAEVEVVIAEIVSLYQRIGTSSSANAMRADALA